MALLFADSFDHYTTSQTSWKSWENLSSRQAGRTGWAYAASPLGGISATRRYIGNKMTTAAEGVALKTGAYANTVLGFQNWQNSAVAWLDNFGDGRFIVRGPNHAAAYIVWNPATYSYDFYPAIAQSDPFDGVLHMNQWQYVEFSATIYVDPTIYPPLPAPQPPLPRPRYWIDYTVRVNEETIATGTLKEVILTEPTINYAVMGNPGGGYVALHDDFWASDGELLGDVRIDALSPFADGDYSEWTPNGGVAHYDRVNQLSPDDDTTYLEALADGLRELYRLAPGNATEIKAVGLWFCVRQAVGVPKVALLLREGGADSEGPSWTPGGGWIYVGELSAGGWSQARLDALQFGLIARA